MFVLSQFLKDNNTLERLDLYANRIESEGCKHIAKAIQTNRTLSFLGLYGCKISDDGALYFLPALQHNKVLKDLILDNNSISEVVLEAISHFLNRNKGLPTKPLPNVSVLIEKLIKKEDLILFTEFLSNPVPIPTNNLLQVNNPIRKSSSQQNIANSSANSLQESSINPQHMKSSLKGGMLDADELDLLQNSPILSGGNNMSNGIEDGANKSQKISYITPTFSNSQQWIAEREKLLQILHSKSIERDTTLHQVAELHQKVKQSIPHSIFE